MSSCLWVFKIAIWNSHDIINNIIISHLFVFVGCCEDIFSSSCTWTCCLGCDIFADVVFDLIITITISSNVIGELAALFFSNHSIQRQLVIQFCEHSYDYRLDWIPLSPVTIVNSSIFLLFQSTHWALRSLTRKKAVYNSFI